MEPVDALLAHAAAGRVLLLGESSTLVTVAGGVLAIGGAIINLWPLGVKR